MKKGFISTFIAILASIVAIGALLYIFQPNLFKNLLPAGITQNITPTTSPVVTGSSTPTSTVDETETIKAAMKAAIIAKRGQSASELTFSVSKIEGNYAKGGASAAGGGAMWFAAKVNGKWTLVWDGNGVILCSDITAYPDFPKDMISECWNDKTNKNVIR